MSPIYLLNSQRLFSYYATHLPFQMVPSSSLLGPRYVISHASSSQRQAIGPHTHGHSNIHGAFASREDLLLMGSNSGTQLTCSTSHYGVLHGHEFRPSGNAAYVSYETLLYTTDLCRSIQYCTWSFSFAHVSFSVFHNSIFHFRAYALGLAGFLKLRNRFEMRKVARIGLCQFVPVGLRGLGPWVRGDSFT
ncbi:hypothetical protein BU26DRAFT_36600 [Trematosphaeria pertusa]|uniref:Uncharacterized protein n=1 Tax=Trematosphaeria pertusa TaxID=390896 RepID=A0A6A6J444_9PLEO|nr:uncharacterized protein BU26DRAFT_36600 [Trematosphaeria pertusa]KAF2257127.1 hypothetical protein BU26DRAFT_36600 [Trematosphaeria pertusa]